jgi:tRNA modification GTPase
MAEKGEFTRRAYLNGKMDLVQAEAVVDLIEGVSPALHRAAIHHLEKGLSARVAGILDGIIQVEAMLAHHLDFPEEDDSPVSGDEIQAETLRLERELEGLLRTAPEGELLREGALTVLAGRPNSGKSSLYNALLGEERAIVTEVPGTTRDALEAVVSLGGFPFRVVDTAGLRGSAARVEQMGIEVAHRYLRKGDLILFCAESGRELREDEVRFLAETRDAPMVLVRTMADDAPRPQPMEAEERGMGEPVEERALRVEATVELSVRTGKGMSALRDLLPSLVFRGLVGLDADTPVLTRARQAEGIRLALRELGNFREALAVGVPAEVAAAHLRPAETALEDLVGVVPREAVLDRLFEDFCIGK